MVGRPDYGHANVLKVELRKDRQMIGSNKRGSASVECCIPQSETLIKINVIQMHKRQDAGEGPRPAEVEARIDALEI